MRREDVRRTDSSKLGRAKLVRREGNQVVEPTVEPIAKVVKPVVAAKPAPKKKSKFGKD